MSISDQFKREAEIGLNIFKDDDIFGWKRMCHFWWRKKHRLCPQLNNNSPYKGNRTLNKKKGFVWGEQASTLTKVLFKKPEDERLSVCVGSINIFAGLKGLNQGQEYNYIRHFIKLFLGLLCGTLLTLKHGQCTPWSQSPTCLLTWHLKNNEKPAWFIDKQMITNDQ